MAKKTGGLAKAARRKMRKRAAGIEVRRKREFTYRGYSIEELKAMTLQEVIELLPSRARRTYT
uniref:SSU ribosomal protein S15e (S19p) n=1 Tax=uncultured euryarchaeote Rifle_16ft_4_minimus_12392 TaxID=1665187 RepID=A0A0H4T2K8_9EURY|nr:SSU ribosomal protein S15e (S19p) [uncultured euryarchaeote Rifle_16ft_4_minimus_12392]